MRLVSCCLAFFLAFVPVLGSEVAGAERKPRLNLVIITIDTLRADHLGLYGYYRNTSPVIDRFARDAFVFENCLTPIATTLPAHLSLFTSTYPLEHGTLANIGHGGRRFDRAAALRLFAEAARDKGYRTGAFVSAPPVSSRTGISAGFDVFDENPNGGRSSAVTVVRAMTWLHSRKPEPFFLWMHIFDPHSPYNPPKKFRPLFRADDEQRARLDERGISADAVRGEDFEGDPGKLHNRYDGEVRFADESVGKLLDKIRAMGYMERTAVMITADHGESLGEHDQVGHGYVWREQLHVPLIVKIPGRIGRRVETPMSLVDALPTFLPLTEDLDWSDFLAQSSGADVLSKSYDPIEVYGQRTARARKDLSDIGFSFTDGRLKLLQYGKNKHLLYDWSVDPFERNDIARKNRKIVRALREKLRERIAGYDERRHELGVADEAEGEEDPELMKRLRALGYVD